MLPGSLANVAWHTHERNVTVSFMWLAFADVQAGYPGPTALRHSGRVSACLPLPSSEGEEPIVTPARRRQPPISDLSLLHSTSALSCVVAGRPGTTRLPVNPSAKCHLPKSRLMPSPDLGRSPKYRAAWPGPSSSRIRRPTATAIAPPPPPSGHRHGHRHRDLEHRPTRRLPQGGCGMVEYPYLHRLVLRAIGRLWNRKPHSPSVPPLSACCICSSSVPTPSDMAIASPPSVTSKPIICPMRSRLVCKYTRLSGFGAVSEGTRSTMRKP